MLSTNKIAQMQNHHLVSKHVSSLATRVECQDDLSSYADNNSVACELLEHSMLPQTSKKQYQYQTQAAQNGSFSDDDDGGSIDKDIDERYLIDVNPQPKNEVHSQAALGGGMS